MKCKVKLTRTVELIVEGKSEEQIQDWLNATTPEGVYLAANGNLDESYDEEIICTVSDNCVAGVTIYEN